LQSHVGVGRVTTYANCSIWAFGHAGAGPAIVAMLEAAASRGNQLWTNRVVQDSGGGAAEPEANYGQRAQLVAVGVPFSANGSVDLQQCPPIVL
jgi:alkylated DNA nucleotide flippase Atl1